MSISQHTPHGAANNTASGLALGEDFPVICDSCLGPNPYTRMIKSTMARECRISGSPFTAFRWQGAHKKWKETLICGAVAQEKNCCQACLNDLEYAVPFHVRDHVMDALGEKVPESDVNKEYHWANKRQKMLDAATAASSTALAGGTYDTYGKLQDNVDKLRELAALETGPVTWTAWRDTPLTTEERERMLQRRQAEKRPPPDQSVTSLYVGGVPPTATKSDLLPYFLAYGPVRDLTVESQRLAAIVTFRERGAAEAAIAAMHNNFTYKGSRLRLSWAKRKGSGAGSSGPGSATAAIAQAGHTYYGPNSQAHGAVVPPPRASAQAGVGAAASGSSKRPAGGPPPGVRLPPGIHKRPAPGATAAPAAAPLYPSMQPDLKGARPDRD